MWEWINRNGQGLSAVFAAFAVAGVLYQVAAGERAQREQSARDIYREFVSLTANKPELAVTQWSDALPAERKAAYEAYVEYMLYTSEQVIAADPEWSGPMHHWLADQSAYLCALDDISGYTASVEALIASIRAEACPG